MEVKATLRNLRIAPRKVRRVADLVRGKTVAEARLQLKFNGMRAAKPLLKLLESGVANAGNKGVDTQTLRISSLMVDQGPMFKRYMARAFGRGAEIQKRCSHIRLVLEGKATDGAPAKPVTSKAKPAKDKVTNPADQEKQPPAPKPVSGKRASASKKPISTEPRRNPRGPRRSNSK